MSNKIIYTNEQMKGDLQEILRQMNAANFTPDFVVGIARGGLVPAVMLSHYLGKPLDCLNVSLRDYMVSHVSEVTDMVRKLKQGRKILLVDDICDSGETLRKIVDEISPQMDDKSWEDNLKVAVLWNNTSQDVFEADFVGREICRADDSRWVIFAYEEWWKV